MPTDTPVEDQEIFWLSSRNLPKKAGYYYTLLIAHQERLASAIDLGSYPTLGKVYHYMKDNQVQTCTP